MKKSIYLKLIALFTGWILIFCIFSSCSKSNDNSAPDSEASDNLSHNSENIEENTDTSGSTQTDSLTSNDITDTEAEAQNDTETSAEQLFIKKFTEMGRSDGFVSESIVTSENQKVKGMLSGYICDIDGDGAEELITTASTGYKNLALSVRIHEYEDGAVDDGYLLVDGTKAYSTVYGYNDLFLKQKNNGYYFCSIIYNTTDWSGIPSEQELNIYEYNSDGSQKCLSVRCINTGINQIGLYVDNEKVYSCNMFGSAEKDSKFTVLKDAVNYIKGVLENYGLSDKLYTDMSGNEITGVSLIGYSENSSDEIAVSYRREAISTDDYSTLQVQMTDKTGILKKVQE